MDNDRLYYNTSGLTFTIVSESQFPELEKLRTRTAPTKKETPKRPRAITDKDLLLLLDEFKAELKKKEDRIAKLEKRIAASAAALNG